MERKIPVWVLALVILLGVNFTVVFGWLVNRVSENRDKLGKFGPIVLTVAKFPTLVKDAITQVIGRSPLIVDNRFPEIDGFKKNGVLQDGAAKDDGYLLLSTYDNRKRQSVVKLIRISDQRLLHEWAPNIRELAENQNTSSRHFDKNNMTASRYRILHPLLADDGGIIFDSFGPLYKVNACSSIEWRIDGIFHHSKEQDADGAIWLPAALDLPSIGNGVFAEDPEEAIVKVSREGKVLFSKSVSGILVENGYRGLLFGAGVRAADTIHLNDVKPALYSTKYWTKGDLLLSLRHLSTVILYRPSTDKIIWLKTGPWLNQHDADFLGQSRISIFGNDVIRIGTGSTVFAEGHNNIHIFDFADGSVATPYSEILKKLDVRTSTEGRQDILDGGDAFVEESNYGRILRISPTQLIWAYTAKIDDSVTAMMNWSRYLRKDEVKNVLPVLSRMKCAQY